MNRWAGAALVLVFTMTACETLPWDKKSDSSGEAGAVEMTETDQGVPAPIVPEPGLRIAPEQRFADVPLPAGLKEDAERTYVYESRNLQIGRMVYTIRVSVNEVAQFYIRECPAAGWTLTSSLQANGAQLSFDKPNKRLDVTVRNVGLPRGGTELILNLTPKELE